MFPVKMEDKRNIGRFPRTVRITARPEFRDDVDVKFVVDAILVKRMKLEVSKIYMIQEFGAAKAYNVTFDSEVLCVKVVETWKREKETVNEYKKIEMELLFDHLEKVVTIHCFNPFVNVNVLSLFLQRYCREVKYLGVITGYRGILTGKYRYKCKFVEDLSSPGGMKHPPSAFEVAGERGYVYYAGQPIFCRKCNQFGHAFSDCKEGKVCRRCNEQGHEARDCKKERLCNVCGEPGHVAKECQIYANAREGWKRAKTEQMRLATKMNPEKCDDATLVEEVERIEREERGGVDDICEKEITGEKKLTVAPDTISSAEKVKPGEEGVNLNQIKEAVVGQFEFKTVLVTNPPQEAGSSKEEGSKINEGRSMQKEKGSAWAVLADPGSQSVVDAARSLKSISRGLGCPVSSTDSELEEDVNAQDMEVYQSDSEESGMEEEGEADPQVQTKRSSSIDVGGAKEEKGNKKHKKDDGAV